MGGREADKQTIAVETIVVPFKAEGAVVGADL